MGALTPKSISFGAQDPAPTDLKPLATYRSDACQRRTEEGNIVNADWNEEYRLVDVSGRLGLSTGKLLVVNHWREQDGEHFFYYSAWEDEHEKHASLKLSQGNARRAFIGYHEILPVDRSQPGLQMRYRDFLVTIDANGIARPAPGQPAAIFAKCQLIPSVLSVVSP